MVGVSSNNERMSCTDPPVVVDELNMPPNAPPGLRAEESRSPAEGGPLAVVFPETGANNLLLKCWKESYGT